jgi:hypothetical protein
MAKAVAGVLDAIGNLKDPIFGKQLFPGFSGKMMGDAAAQANNAAGDAAGRSALLRMNWDRNGKYDMQAQLEEDQRGRSARRLQEDPFRNQSFSKRVSDAFMGNGRDTSDQDKFWTNFANNRMDIARALFAGSTATPAAAGFPGAPQLYGGGGGRGSVTTLDAMGNPMNSVWYKGRWIPKGRQGPMGAMAGPNDAGSVPVDLPEMPAIQADGFGPSNSRYMLPGESSADYISRRDAGVTGMRSMRSWDPNFQGGRYDSAPGGVTININATITREGMIAAAVEAYDEMVRRGIAGPAAF